jgi:lipopolysaccharide heptosyltransferase II
VIRQHDQLGDMLCAVPLLRALRQKYNSAHIVLVTSPVNHGVMVNNPYVNEIIRYDKREFLERGKLRVGRAIQLIRSLRARRFDLAIVPSTVSFSVTSDLLAFLSGASHRVGAGSVDGTANPASALFNAPVQLDWRNDLHRHQAIRNLDIARELELPTPDLASVIGLTEEEGHAAKEYLAHAGLAPDSFVAFHPGAGKPGNRWPARNFASIAQAIHREFSLGVLITCGPMDADALADMKARLSAPCHIVEKKSIREVAAILAHARLVISNDTGIMHVAAAVGAPVLSLFGPTDPQQWAPVGQAHRFLEAPDGRIASIPVARVLAAVREMLARNVEPTRGVL